jgi:formamidopyrimidine-DNA glycosylase
MISIEGPEIRVLAGQAAAVLPGRTIVGYDLRDVDRLTRIGFVNPDRFDLLTGSRIERVRGRGVLLALGLTGGRHLLIGPEYGGTVRLLDGHLPVGSSHVSIHLEPVSTLQIRLTGMGTVQLRTDDDLADLYVYARDFGDVLSPGEETFTRARFTAAIRERRQQLKPVFVGKQAIVTGYGNASFQEVAFLAGIHPRRTAASLTDQEIDRIYDVITESFARRIAAGGKIGFAGLDGAAGRYPMAMGPEYRDKPCPRCGVAVERISYGGGPTYFCPGCQQ